MTDDLQVLSLGCHTFRKADGANLETFELHI